MKKFTFDIPTATHHYLYAALWTEELEAKFDVEDFMPTTVGHAAKDIQEFIHKAGDLLVPYAEHFGDKASEQLGHDFWLSRNGHGAGFFDHKLGGVEQQLQDIARKFPERHVWDSETGTLFIE